MNRRPIVRIVKKGDVMEERVNTTQPLRILIIEDSEDDTLLVGGSIGAWTEGGLSIGNGLRRNRL